MPKVVKTISAHLTTLKGLIAHRYMLKVADKRPLTDLPGANSLHGTLVVFEERQIARPASTI